jgi:hypothetical protein
MDAAAPADRDGPVDLITMVAVVQRLDLEDALRHVTRIPA